MTYLKDNVIDGIETYDFHLSSDLFSCSKKKREGFIDQNCLGNGVFNLSNCQNGKRISMDNILKIIMKNLFKEFQAFYLSRIF